jgi:hypothetical protein
VSFSESVESELKDRVIAESAYYARLYRIRATDPSARDVLPLARLGRLTMALLHILLAISCASSQVPCNQCRIRASRHSTPQDLSADGRVFLNERARPAHNRYLRRSTDLV